jgi:hypothetical protein
LGENIAMISIKEDLAALTALGHKVESNPGACVLNGDMHVLIDGKLMSAIAIHQMAHPPDRDTYGFEAQGKQYEVRIYFLYGENAYEIYQDGHKMGERQRLGGDPLDFMQRTAESMGCTGSFRKI